MAERHTIPARKGLALRVAQGPALQGGQHARHADRRPLGVQRRRRQGVHVDGALPRRHRQAHAGRRRRHGDEPGAARSSRWSRTRRRASTTPWSRPATSIGTSSSARRSTTTTARRTCGTRCARSASPPPETPCPFNLFQNTQYVPGKGIQYLPTVSKPGTVRGLPGGDGRGRGVLDLPSGHAARSTAGSRPRRTSSCCELIWKDRPSRGFFTDPAPVRSGVVPEGADVGPAGRLRRRIRLISAGCRGQSRMTVVRRELPRSRSASRPNPRTRRRIVRARALQSCPHRARRDAAQEAHVMSLAWSTTPPAPRRVVSWRPR